MAKVYRGFDSRLQVQRAIKILSPELAKRRSLRVRFEGEASTMALLEHPNIVRVYDVGADGERVYIVMELVDGGSLLDRVKLHGNLPPRMAVQVTIDMLDALDVAHRRGVVHRDIKPHNILLSTDGKLRITDFGIARIDNQGDDGMTKTGAVMGTWGFMAPEQRVDAKSVDVRADIYSTGATLYSVLTGKTPVDLFVADMDKGLLAGIDPELAEVIKRSTRYDREERYTTAAEMANALRAILELLPADPPETPELLAAAADLHQQRHLAPVGGGTGLLDGSGSSPAPRSAGRVIQETAIPEVGPPAPSALPPSPSPGPAPALGTMVPDDHMDPEPLPPAQAPTPAPKPALGTDHSGLTLSAPEEPTVPQRSPPYALIGGGLALLIALAGGLWWASQEPEVQPDPIGVTEPPPPEVQPIETQPVEPPPVETPPVETQPVATPEKDPPKDPVTPVVRDTPKDPAPEKDPVKPAVDPQPKDPPVTTVTVPQALTHTKPSSARAGSPLTLSVGAPDGYTVTLYYRSAGGGRYSAQAMRYSGSGYSTQITPDASYSAGLEYYIQAKPKAGGELLKKGSGFSPLKVPVK